MTTKMDIKLADKKDSVHQTHENALKFITLYIILVHLVYSCPPNQCTSDCS